MEDEERLKAKLAMFVSGCKGWVAEAEEQDVDDDAIEEVKQAHEHIREAFRILDE
ncbi:hypothetical protein [Natrinema salaciae]|uniref:Uncharacterized protein n=1 Tax=Natrinema salaciae TaxID=1186196 RepID=A0A1H9PW12_9EURY|nr:hypothetical protein [Natrinema salaciae]SER51949.1 hypothetical protein SAMN04489841_3986 [Natrinema salaciae]